MIFLPEKMLIILAISVAIVSAFAFGISLSIIDLLKTILVCLRTISMGMDRIARDWKKGV